MEEDDIDEIARFLSNETGDFLSEMAQDLIQESYGNFWEDLELVPATESSSQVDCEEGREAERTYHELVTLEPPPRNDLNPAQQSPAGRPFAAADDHLQNEDDQLELKEKPHACPVCGRAFGRKSDLTRHTKETHSDSACFYCPYCMVRFTRRPNCLRHLRTKCDLVPVGLGLSELAKPLTSVFGL